MVPIYFDKFYFYYFTFRSKLFISALWRVLGAYTHGKEQNPSAFALKMEPNGRCYHIGKTV